MKNKNNILIIILGLVFILLSVFIKLDLTISFDNAIYELLTFNMSNLVTNFYKVITLLGSTEFIIFLCIFFLILFIILKKRNYGYLISIVLIISTVINNVLKLIVRRERPLVLSFVEEHSFSFPSGHTMAAVSMYGILIYLILKSNLSKKLKGVISAVLGIIPVLVALSRVYLGAHFMSDVIGGIIVSTILLIVITYFVDKKNLI